MKPLKMLGLAALAALTAMMLVGVSSAMAANTALCKKDENPCAAADLVKHVHEETAAGAPALLLNDLGDVKCDVLFLGEVLGLAAPQVIHGNFTYSNCKRGEEECKVTELLEKTLLKVLRTADEKATVTGEGEVKVVCGAFIVCSYNGKGLEGSGFGALEKGPNGETTLENQKVEKTAGGFICPKEAKLDILTKPLVATYIKS